MLTLNTHDSFIRICRPVDAHSTITISNMASQVTSNWTVPLHVTSNRKEKSTVRITDPLWTKSKNVLWIPLTKASDAESILCHNINMMPWMNYLSSLTPVTKAKKLMPIPVSN